MTASEFAFLALGLVLGVAAGAALVEVARSRPPGRREVRVTVAPNSIRSRASTLAEESSVGDPVGPARGGPADRSWVDREADDDDAPPGEPPGDSGATSADPRGGAGEQDGAEAEPTSDDPPGRTPVPFILQPSGAWSGATFRAPPSILDALPHAGALPGGSGRPSIGIPISSEPDPEMAAFQPPVAAMARAEGQVAVAAQGGDRTKARTSKTGSVAGAAAVLADDEVTAGSPSTDDSGPCADERRVADERCAVATRARDGARRAAEALRTAQREYDDHIGKSETLAANADPRAVRTAKETAQAAFRAARATAATRDTVETAARDWLTEINRINLATREALSQVEHHRTAANVLAPTLERLAVEADAARISAESAEEACVAAREAVAGCEEAAAAAATDAAMRRPGLPLEDEPERADEPGTGVAATAAPDESILDDEAMGSRAGEEAAIIRLLRGDREILPRIVARLAADDADEERRWRGLLSSLVEALVARSIEAASFDFPTTHPFWGLFNRTQSREIAAALASLGYRHDGFGGWAEERIPSQRDLSLAVGYAGLDPMRIRHWPAEAEMRDLLSDVTVAADEYIWEAAGALTLGDLVSLLGRRADGLTDLWNDWGAVRPLLLAAG